jgi:DNA polymerase III delta prime subunit
MNIYHHGYLLTGDVGAASRAATKMASEILEEKESSLRAHPDFSILKKETLTIGDARQIRENSSKSSFSGKGRVFVIQADFLTSEASNALLKTLEEPIGLSYFFLITASLGDILQTLRSRLVVSRFERVQKLSDEKRMFVEKFLSSLVPERIKLVKDFASEKEKTTGFLDGLEIVLRDGLLERFSEDIVKSLGELKKVRGFLSQRSSSLKMIIDHLCLTLPRFDK